MNSTQRIISFTYQTSQVYVNPIGYWKQMTNKLDFFILIVSFAQIFMISGQSGGSTSGKTLMQTVLIDNNNLHWLLAVNV